jgi:hypothetical protein
MKPSIPRVAVRFARPLLAAWAVGGLWPTTSLRGAPQAAPEARSAAPSLAPGDVHVGHSRVYIRVGKTGLGHEHAVMGLLSSGRVALGAGERAGELVFDLRRFTADSEPARQFLRLEGDSSAATQQKVTANMLGPDVLHVAKYPVASCQLQSVQPTGQVSPRQLPYYEFTGQFTLHGVTRPIRFTAEVETRPGWQHAMGSFTIRQTDYGILPVSKAFGAIGVANELAIYGDLWIAAQPAAAAAAEGDVQSAVR